METEELARELEQDRTFANGCVQISEGIYYRILQALRPTEAVRDEQAVGEGGYRLMLLDLLAVIHRDGGHKTHEIGIKLAWEQAMQLSSERIAALRQATPAPDEGLRELTVSKDLLIEALRSARHGREMLIRQIIHECPKLSGEPSNDCVRALAALATNSVRDAYESLAALSPAQGGSTP